MGAAAKEKNFGSATDLGGVAATPLDPKRERALLEELAECRRTLAAALAGQDPRLVVPEMTRGPGEMSRFLAEAFRTHGKANAAISTTFQRYFELRTELSLCNVRLVAHVARRYRDRGVSFSDLLQEGLLGLLEAIDRFDPAHSTRLATYATWWIRQAVQTAVAAGAYPVRLAPRHLRQLARDGRGHDPERPDEGGRPRSSDEIMSRIQAATRPAVSLSDPTRTSFAMTTPPDREHAEQEELGEAIGQRMGVLRPRERQVLSYRFGLGGSPCLSLSQVGEVLDVSKERVRQIQEAALKRLRANVSHELLAPSC